MKLKPLRYFLVILSPLGGVLAPYLAGLGIISSGRAIGANLASMLILPFIVSTVIVISGTPRGIARIAVYVATLLLQLVLSFAFVPPVLGWEVMGLAHRLRREFSPLELRKCADEIRDREQKGTLQLKQTTNPVSVPWPDDFVIDESQVPSSLRGRFLNVRLCCGEEGSSLSIWKSKDSSAVVFELRRDCGIICGTNDIGMGLFRYPMAEGVYAYKYSRP